MAVRLMVIVFILGVGMCGVLFKGRDTVLSLFSENSCGHCTFSSSGFSPKDVEGGEKDFPQHIGGTRTRAKPVAITMNSF